MDCLRCRAVMERRPVHGVLLDHCSACGGVWLDGGELEALAYGLEAEWAELSAQARVEARSARDRAVDVHGLCPRCQSKLETRLVGGTEIDRCRACGGMYLDRGELQDLVTRHRPGPFRRLWYRLRRRSRPRPS